jgi:hypothetical protein
VEHDDRVTGRYHDLEQVAARRQADVERHVALHHRAQRGREHAPDVVRRDTVLARVPGQSHVPHRTEHSWSSPTHRA